MGTGRADPAGVLVAGGRPGVVCLGALCRAVAPVVCAALLGGCDSHHRSDAAASGSGPTALVRVSTEAAGDPCPGGGVRVDAGLDLDGDGALDDAEVSSTQDVCNGAAGPEGSDGHTTLVRTRSEPAGIHCSGGGSQVLAGPDLDGDGVLGDAEVSTSAYVCDGAPGLPGADGRDSLISILAESPGAVCTHGGERVLSGLDLDGDGVLDSGEVRSTAYLCSPAPASWVEVTGYSVQAQPDTGYLASSSAEVVVTLPADPAPGDWIGVTGVGSGGWRIAQNAGQRISARALPGGLELGWMAQALAGNWVAVASSADGTRLVAASASGQLYTSIDGGQAWVQRLSGQVWSGVASSSDGLKLVAVVNGGSIHRSVDGGATWSNDGSARAWSAVASSADGGALVATAYLGQLWISTDGGTTWTAHESNRAWRAVSASADGGVLVAATNGGQLYVSTDHGATWTAAASAQYWWSVTSSADGQQIFATVDTGAIWRSSDRGRSFEAVAPDRAWRGIASSTDGRYVIAAAFGGRLYESADGGESWHPTGDAASWTGVASSADGLKVVGAPSGAALQIGSRRATTTPGTAGWISGGTEDSLQLQYVGDGLFVPIGYALASLAFGVN